MSVIPQFPFVWSLGMMNELVLTHWGRVAHKCVNKLTIIGSDNGLSHDRRQAIIWTNAGILSIGPLGTNVSEIFIGIHTFPFKKMHLKMSSGKCRPFCPGLNVLTHWAFVDDVWLQAICLILVRVINSLMPGGAKPLPEPLLNHQT